MNTHIRIHTPVEHWSYVLASTCCECQLDKWSTCDARKKEKEFQKWKKKESVSL